MSTFEALAKIADNDVTVINGSTKPTSDETIAINVDVDIAREELDDLEERNAATIEILADTVNATESKDLTQRELNILRASMKAITGTQVIKQPAMESDNQISNTSIALEGLKETLKKFWNFIKEQVKKFWALLKRWWLKTFDISKRTKVRAKKLSEQADREYGVSTDSDLHFKEIKKLAIDGRINDNNAIVYGLKNLEELVFEFVNTESNEKFNETVEVLSDKTASIISGIKSLADAIVKEKGSTHRLGKNELVLRTADMDEFTDIVERCLAKTDSELVNDDKFVMDNAEKYKKQFGDIDKTSFKHSKPLPGDKWILCTKPASKTDLGYTIDLTDVIEGLRRARLYVANNRYAEKQYDAEPQVKVLSTSLISRGCDSIVNICEYINEYRLAFERRDKFKERIIKDIDLIVNEVSGEHEDAYVECDRMVRSFANVVTGLIRRRTDFETNLCAYSISSSVAFLNFSEASLKLYSK